jgi:hypothetical protein
MVLADLSSERDVQALSQTYLQLKNKIDKMRVNLTIKIENLVRKEGRTPLSSFGEGAQSEYDILREFKNIRKILTGEKGWSFISFLLSEAKQEFAEFKTQFEKWNSVKDNRNKQRWACRNAFEVSTHWSLANSAIELIYNQLGASSDLWSDNGAKYRWFLKVIPYARSYNSRLVKALKSAEFAKSYLQSRDPKLLEKVDDKSSTFTKNFGELIIQIKDSLSLKVKLDEFRQTEGCLQLID